MRKGKIEEIATYQLNPQMTARLQAIDWFRRCGQPDRLSLDMAAEYVSWEQAKEYYHAQDWEDITLEASNVLTRHLAFNHRQEYNKRWNVITEVAKEFMKANLEPKWIAYQTQQGLDKTFLDCVNWDILAAMMEDAYAYCHPPIHFFSELLRVYEAGHFPCGWEGEWPNGKLIVL